MDSLQELSTLQELHTLQELSTSQELPTLQELSASIFILQIDSEVTQPSIHHEWARFVARANNNNKLIIQEDYTS